VVGEARDPDGDTGPLDGLTVLDASRVLVGPFCTMQLGDLGAEVIKIERPGEGDQTRTWRPPAFGEGDGAQSAYYASVNRNKRSVELNLAGEAGRAGVPRPCARGGRGRREFPGREDGRVGPRLPRPRRGEPRADLLWHLRVRRVGSGPRQARLRHHDAGARRVHVDHGCRWRPPVRIGVALADIGAGCTRRRRSSRPS